MLLWALPARAQSGTKERRMAKLRRRCGQYALLAARPDQRRQLLQAAGRLAIQDRQPGAHAGRESRRHSADGEGRLVRDGGNAAERDRTRCRHRRIAMEVQRKRRPTRSGRTPAALRPWPRLLDRWDRRTHRLRHAGLPDDRLEREDRHSGSLLRQERRGGSEGRRRSGDRPA